MARRSPTRRLKRVDLPTLGRPTMATIGFATGAPLVQSTTNRAPVQAPHWLQRQCGAIGATASDYSSHIVPDSESIVPSRKAGLLLANERLDEAVDPGARISLGGAKQEVGLQRWIDGAKVET